MVRWGVMGTARIARNAVIPAILKSRNGMLAAVASRDAAQARAAIQSGLQTAAYGSYAALLEDPQIDAVYIPLPNHLHKAWTIKALEAGKHVLVEKPFGMDAGEAEAMVEAAYRHGKLLMEAFMYRFHPRSLRIKQLVDEGAIGKVRLIHAAFSFPTQRDGSNERLFTQEMGGGSLWDVGCYGVDVARWLTGEEPQAVTAQALLNEDGVDLHFTGTLRFASGTLATVQSSFGCAVQQAVTVVGESGAIEVAHSAFGPGEADVEYMLRGDRERRGQVFTVAGADEYQLMVEHFADAALGRAPLAYPPEKSILQMRALDALADCVGARHASPGSK